jgi:hypothetical protein
MPSRRHVLRGTAALSAAALAPPVAAQSDTPSASDYWDARPSHVTLSYNESVLERYKPMVVTQHLDYQPNAFYALLAESTHRDSSIAVYWADYDRQEGLSPFGGKLSDSHLGDHEPCYVEFDPATDRVISVRYSAYHWLTGRAPSYGISLHDETHPQFRVIKPWHQYAITPDKGVLDVPLESLLEATPDFDTRFDEWLVADDLANALRVGSVTNPWIMSEHESWWQDTMEAFGLGWSSYELTAKLYRAFSSLPGADYGGADASDPIQEVE